MGRQATLQERSGWITLPCGRGSEANVILKRFVEMRVGNGGWGLRYFITFACYGGRLHGDGAGSVDPVHNQFGSRLLAPDPQRVLAEHQKMGQPPYQLDQESRAAVLAAMRHHCALRGWNLLAAHVRTSHVHVVVDAQVPPERVMNEFKSYASRELNRLGRDGADRRRWARHGSTRWLWNDRDVEQAIGYVIDEQGAPMAQFVAEEV